MSSTVDPRTPNRWPLIVAAFAALGVAGVVVSLRSAVAEPARAVQRSACRARLAEFLARAPDETPHRRVASSPDAPFVQVALTFDEAPQAWRAYLDAATPWLRDFDELQRDAELDAFLSTGDGWPPFGVGAGVRAIIVERCVGVLAGRAEQAFAEKRLDAAVRHLGDVFAPIRWVRDVDGFDVVHRVLIVERATDALRRALERRDWPARDAHLVITPRIDAAITALASTPSREASEASPPLEQPAPSLMTQHDLALLRLCKAALAVDAFREQNGRWPRALGELDMPLCAVELSAGPGSSIVTYVLEGDAVELDVLDADGDTQLVAPWRWRR